MSITKLNNREHMFCTEYLTNGRNAAAAARASGYSGDGKIAGARLIARPSIKQFLKDLQPIAEKKLQEDVEVTLEWKIRKLKLCADTCLKEDPETGEAKLVSAPGFIGSISELNKMQGHYAPEKTLNAHFVGSTEQQEVEKLVKQYDKEY